MPCAKTSSVLGPKFLKLFVKNNNDIGNSDKCNNNNIICKGCLEYKQTLEVSLLTLFLGK